MTKISICASVSFNEKDLAKKLGAKWDLKNKRWYWEFDFNEFCDNGNDLHTFFFKPYSVGIEKMNGISESIRCQYIDSCFKIAKQRQLEYCKNNQKPIIVAINKPIKKEIVEDPFVIEEIIEVQKPFKTLYESKSICRHCVYDKLDEEIIKEILKNHYFGSGCDGCMNHYKVNSMTEFY
jgi:hypothetical protein